MSTLHWKWEDEEPDGEGVGPVWILHADGSEENWDHWARRSEAEKFAQANDHEFDADE